MGADVLHTHFLEQQNQDKLPAWHDVVFHTYIWHILRRQFLPSYPKM